MNVRILALILQSAAPAFGALRHLTFLGRLWRYIVLGATSIVFEETNPIWGGIAVRRGRLSVFGVVLAVSLGVWIASAILYALGRWRIAWVQRRFPQQYQMLDGALRMVRRNPWGASLLIRFAYGLRLPLPIACGAAGVPIPTFLVAAAVSCIAWAAVFVYLGVTLGRAAFSVIAWTHPLDVRLSIVAILLFVLLSILTRRRWNTERAAEARAAEMITPLPAPPEEWQPPRTGSG